MNIIVFDSNSETSQIWLELASAQGFRASVYHSPDRLNSLTSDTQVVVIDQSIVPEAFLPRIATFCKQNPGLQVIATGATLRIDDAVDLMLAGASFVFSKPLSRPRILAALPDLEQKAAQTAAKKLEYQQLNDLFSRLTTREKDVLSYILVGTSNKDTAALLNVSVRTIESRRAKVYRKLEANNVAELVRKIDRLESLRKIVAGQPQPKSGPEYLPRKNDCPALHSIPNRYSSGTLRPEVCRND